MGVGYTYVYQYTFDQKLDSCSRSSDLWLCTKVSPYCLGNPYLWVRDAIMCLPCGCRKACACVCEEEEERDRANQVRTMAWDCCGCRECTHDCLVVQKGAQLMYAEVTESYVVENSHSAQTGQMESKSYKHPLRYVYRCPGLACGAYDIYFIANTWDPRCCCFASSNVNLGATAHQERKADPVPTQSHREGLAAEHPGGADSPVADTSAGMPEESELDVRQATSAHSENNPARSENDHEHRYPE
eukprot:CAMPEP_0170196000 /NCGR_PEP_ID=MMETSP0040_2-20121228/62825_1 /TAXON_ID=641309 /ORGANISM="Lotharella oceanica, Strain CCMP622" /LENGTH=243 /DNA_ID=CAMNT_0010445309 /DNA_START=23 /DNA_END=754 /DNA_ORIENTATION=+